MKLKPFSSCLVAAVILLLVLLPTAALSAVVVCEPQGATPHPPTYWYDVTPQNPFT